MKYGIQLVAEDGSVQYAYSAKAGRPSFTSTLVDAALFAQEETAVKTVRRLRLDGYEPKGTSFSVIEVQCVIERVIDVERPAKKTGVIMSLSLPKSTVYYTGSKKGEVSYRQSDIYHGWGTEARATVFESEFKARMRLAELIAYQVEDERGRRADLARTNHINRDWLQICLDKAIEQQELYKTVEFHAVG